MIKVYVQKQLNDTLLIGKVNRDGKTKWKVKIKVLGNMKFRKSRFSSIEQFEKFIKEKYKI